MKLILAEKPSVANEIAQVLGATKKKKGYFINDEYIITHAVGHLLRLAEPEEYNQSYKKWCVGDLPIIPEKFKFMVSESTQGQFEIIKELMSSDIKEIINAADAGREGELIFRLIYNEIAPDPAIPVKRLWISSMTEESIKNGMSNLRPGKAFDNLYLCAVARLEGDWLHGINFTRYYTIKNNLKLSVGRVQTPTLALIVRRDDEIKGFVKETFYAVQLGNKASWFEGEKDCFEKKQDAEAIKDKCLNKTAVITDVKSELKTVQKPLLFNLNGLQQEANRKLGFTAQKTLDTAQALYEKHKLITYPRTDSNYLTEDMEASAVNILQFIKGAGYMPDVIDRVTQKNGKTDNRVIDNSKVSDHHAIIPTEKIDTYLNKNLTNDELSLLSLIMDRFILAFSEKHVYEQSTYIITIEGETFKLRANKIVQIGFKEFYKDEEDDTEAAPVVSFKKGDTFTADKIDVMNKVTQPKKHFTEASLLGVMENISNEITDSDKKKYVKERGLGTPATRASIIETLISRGYIERKSKNLLSTELGKALIDMLPEKVKDVEMTAEWEEILLDVEKGLRKGEELIDGIIANLTAVIKNEDGGDSAKINVPPKKDDKEVIGVCPRCKNNVYESEKNFYCSGYRSQNCKFSMFKEDRFFTEKGKSLGKTTAKNLLKDGTAKVTSLKSKSGATYDAIIELVDKPPYVNYKIKEFVNSDKDKKK